MEQIKSLGKSLKKYFNKKENSKTKYVLIFGITGIFLLIFSDCISESKNIEQASSNLYYCENESDLEDRVENAIEKIKGAGKTEVTLTFDSSKEYFYAKNSIENNGENENEKETEYVIRDGESREEPVLIKSVEAKIRGVLVVCEGGNKPYVQEKIIEAVCALLDVPSNKVSVAEMA